jgi:RNA polymerase sigma-70 factor, ECF subfamily
MSEVRELIRDQIPALRRYARALVRDRDSADDLVQDTLVRAINAEHQWQPGTNLRAWLFTILHNVYVGDRRKLARRPSVVPIDSEEWRLEAPSNQVPTVQLGELDRAISTLPEHQRMTLLLVGLQGMAYEEVAQIMGVPLGTVRSRLSRARHSLQELLDAAQLPQGMAPPETPQSPENESAA